MKFKEWIKQFPKLEQSWNSLPEPNRTWYEGQIFAYAQEQAKVFSSNAVLAVTSDSKENNKESEVAVCVVDGCKEVGYMGKYCHKHFYEMGKTQTYDNCCRYFQWHTIVCYI